MPELSSLFGGTAGALTWDGAGNAAADFDSGAFASLAPAPSGDTTGATDTAAVQAAIDALNTAGGGVLRLHVGVYYVNASLVLYDSIALEGTRPSRNDLTRGTVVRTASNAVLAGAPIVDVSDTTYAAVRDIEFYAPSGNTTLGISDFGDNTTQATFLTIDGNHFEGFGGTVIGLYGNVNTITNNRADNSASHFIHLKNSGGAGPGTGSDSFVAFNESGACAGNGSAPGANGSAIYIEGGSTSTVLGNHLYNFKYGIHLDNADHVRVEGNRCEKHDYDGILLDSSDGNTVLGNHCFNNGYVSSKVGINVKGASLNNQIVGNFVYNQAAWAGGTNTDYGILVTGASLYTQVNGNTIWDVNKTGIRLYQAVNCQANSNLVLVCGEDGIALDQSSNQNQIVGNYVYQAGQDTNATWSGIALRNSSSTNLLSGNVCRHGGGATKTAAGISVVGAGAGNNRVLGNDLDTGTGGSMVNTGTTTFFRDNVGFTSEGCGLATVASGTTSIAVSHGVGWTPTVRNITVTPTNNLGTATKWWITNVTSTQFTINVDVDPGATTATFSWRVHNIVPGQTI